MSDRKVHIYAADGIAKCIMAAMQKPGKFAFALVLVLAAAAIASGCVFAESGGGTEGTHGTPLSEGTNETPPVEESYEAPPAEDGSEAEGGTVGATPEAGLRFSRNFIFELFDSGGGMDVGLVIGGIEHNIYFTNIPWHVEGLDALMSDFSWSLPGGADNVGDLLASSPYSVTVESKDKRMAFTFFGGSDKVHFRSDEGEALYSLTWKYDGEASLAAHMRTVYDILDMDESRLLFIFDGTPVHDVARHFAEDVYAEHFMSLAPGGQYSITDYQVVRWGVTDVSDGENAVLGWFTYAVIPETPSDSSALWAGNTGEGEDGLEGWLVMSREFVLEKGDDGYWRCTGFGTGGFTLPD